MLFTWQAIKYLESLLYTVLTELYTWGDGNEWHDYAQADVNAYQPFVQETASRMGEVCIQEIEGQRGNGIEDQCGNQDSKIPAFVFICTGQPEEREKKASIWTFTMYVSE